MAYIEFKEVMVKQVCCSHPKVEKIWCWGGSPVNPADGTIKEYTSLILENRQRFDFESDQEGLSIDKAEAFLCNLPE